MIYVYVCVCVCMCVCMYDHYLFSPNHYFLLCYQMSKSYLIYTTFCIGMVITVSHSPILPQITSVNGYNHRVFD